MALFALLYGLFIIGLGYFVRKWPDTISGYSTMSPRRKKYVDIKGLSRMLQRSFFVAGLATIGGYFIFRFAGLATLADIMLFLPIFVSSAVAVIRAPHYDHFPRKRRPFWTWFIASLLVVGCILLLFYASRPTRVDISATGVSFSGEYGIELTVTEIARVELLESIPAGSSRVGGLALGNIRKGYFVMGSWGRCLLLLESAHGPYIVITQSDGKRIIYNSRDTSATRNTYDRLLQLFSPH